MYSKVIREHFSAPRNVGELESPDFRGVSGSPGEGPYFILTFRARHGHLIACRFQTYGCAPAIAAGSVLTEAMEGRPIEEWQSWTVERLVDALGGVPEEKMHCPALAIEALRDAFKSSLGVDRARHHAKTTTEDNPKSDG